MKYTIEYHGNYGLPLVIQVNFNIINKIHFINGGELDLVLSNDHVIAIWKVKSLKPKPFYKPYTLDTSFSLN